MNWIPDSRGGPYLLLRFHIFKDSPNKSLLIADLQAKTPGLQ